MNKKHIIPLLLAALVTGCAGTKNIDDGKSPVSELFIPVDQVKPEIPQARIRIPKATAKTKMATRKATYAERRVVQVDAPTVGELSVNIQEGSTRGVRNVTSMYGENHSIPVSINYPTLFITPFASPELKGDAVKAPVDYEVVGSNIIAIPQKNRRSWVMIYDKANPRGMPISLTLIPKPGLLSQTINLTVGRLSPSEYSNGLDAEKGGFAQQLAAVLNDIAKLRIPAGYTVRPLKEKITMQNGMQTMPVERYTSSRFDVYRYRLTNTTTQMHELVEEMFGKSKRVRAVAIFPKKVLYPGEVTDVLIMTSKNGGLK